MKIQSYLCVGLCCVVCVTTACRSNDDMAQTTPLGLNADDLGLQDVTFLREAFNASLHEIEAARIASERAQNSDLKLLARRIHDDHAKATSELRLLARQQGISLPPDNQQFASTDQLSNTPNARFDETFLTHMMEMHEEDIKKFDAAARDARSPEIRDFAGRFLPVFREHQRVAENIFRASLVNEEIEEPAGAERRGRAVSPYYGGDSKRDHQFD